MKNHSRSAGRVVRITALTLILSLLLAALPALSDQGAAYAANGDAGRSAIFYVTSKGASSLTLAQTADGQMQQVSNWDGSQRYRTLSGMYHVYYSSSREEGTVEFTEKSAVLSFRYSGSYTVTVQPYTVDEINTALSAQRTSTDWLYTCKSWSSLPKWEVQSPVNCSVQTGGPVVPVITAAPGPVPAVSSFNYPSTLTRGSTFALKGTVYAPYGRVTHILGEIYDAAGNRIRSASVYPYSASYSLESSSSFSDSLRFDQLEAGTYTYRLSATAANDGVTGTAELINRSFRVTVPAATATPNLPVLYITGANTPASIILGTPFVPKGTITVSSGSITQVKGEILDGSQNAVCSVTRYPYSTSYTLENDSTFNNSLRFSQLPSGRYTYRVTATAQNGSRTQTTVLVQSGFYIYAAATATPTPAVQTPVLSVSNQNYPSSMAQGSAFVPRGVIRTSCGQITRVTGEILNASGNVEMTVNRYPYQASFDLGNDSSFNNSLKFSQLRPGSYVYRVTATAQNGAKTATQVLVQSSFTVYNNATATPAPVTRIPSLSVSNENVPSSFAQGSAFVPRGVIRTDCGQITRVTGEILNGSGTVLMSVNRYPYQASFDLGSDSTFNNSLKFSQLAPGSYVYRVTATAQNGGQTATNAVINAGFYVFSAATPTPAVREPVLTISYPSYPTAYEEGTAFYPRGIINTDCGKITKVTGEILNSSGSVLMSVNRYPDQDTTSYVLDNDNTFNNNMRFSRLNAGSYIYRVTATAQNGGKSSTATLINASFEVYRTVTPVITPVLSITDENYPTAYVTGSSFHPRGVIRVSAGTISRVTGEILDNSGRVLMSVDRYPSNQQSYDLNTDNTYNYAMKFSQLPVGSYIYRVTASAQNGGQKADQILIYQTFVVYDNVTAAPVTQPPVTPAPVTQAPVTPGPVTPAPVTAVPGPSSGDLYITDAAQPTEVRKGGSFDARGTVRSDSGEIIEVLVEICKNGQPIRRVAIHPFSSAVRLEKYPTEMTKGLRFDLLDAGNYTYQISAKVRIGTRPVSKTLLQCTFNVAQ